MKPRRQSGIEDATLALSAADTGASPAEDVATVDAAEAQPQTTPASQFNPDTSRRSHLKIFAVGVAALLVLATLGLASTQNTFGDRTPTEAPGTHAAFLGSTQGCASSYWAMPAHFSAWQEYVPDQPVSTMFSHASNYADMSLTDALGNQTTGEDARRTLLREAVAAALNAANDSLAFPYARYDDGVDGRPPIVPTTNHLLTSGSDTDIAQFTTALSQANDLGCPL